MNTSKNTLTPSESINIINEMIANAKEKFTKNSPFFIGFGIIMMTAGIMEFILKTILQLPYFFIVWPIAGAVGGLMSYILGKRLSKDVVVLTFTDRTISQVWLSYVISLIFVIIGAISLKADPGSFVMILTGLPTFLTGKILKFNPLIVGGIIFWTIGIVSFFFLYEYQSLLFSLAIFLGYLIPGVLLKKQEEKEN